VITIVARWETAQMPAEIEWQLWRQLKGAFFIKQFNMVPVIPDFDRGNQVRQYDTIEEALENAEGERAFLEPKGHRSMAHLPLGDIVLVLGDTNKNNLALAGDDETYRIETPGRTVLYGTNAVAIALAIRSGQ